MQREISVAEARNFVLERIERLGAETVFLGEAGQRVLAEDLSANRPIPPWDNSAMDGYALRHADLAPNARLEVVEEIFAGRMPSRTIGPGQASRIMTGAPMPEGADTVLPVELVARFSSSEMVVGSPARLPARNEHVRCAGEDLRPGERVLSAGTVLSPAAVGLAASLGRATVQVWRRPQVAVLSTGDEIAEVGSVLEPGQIYSSNSHSLCAAVRLAGAVPVYLGIARDTREDLRIRLSSALACDMVLTTGGVSVGDADFVKEVLSELGGEVEFWRVAQRPGYPLAFGSIEGRPVFGLPGNPVSTLVSFQQYVQPAIFKMAGRTRLFPPVVDAILEEDVHTRPGKTHFLRGVLSRADGSFRVRTTGGQGSGILSSMHHANGLVVIGADRSGAARGETVRVQVIDPDFWLGETAGF